MIGNLRERQHALADGGVEDCGLAARHFGQYYEVIQIPVQDARKPELADILHFQPQGTSPKTQGLRDVNQLIEVGTFKRLWETLTQFG